jgi:hypothetical protein
MSVVDAFPYFFRIEPPNSAKKMQRNSLGKWAEKKTLEKAANFFLGKLTNRIVSSNTLMNCQGYPLEIFLKSSIPT